MRIAIIAEVFLPKVDGVVIRTTNLIRQLTARGDDVLVVCPEAGARGACPAPILEFRSFPFPSYPEYRIGIPDVRLARGLERFAPDVLHFINPFAFGFRCLDVLQKARIDVPSVFSFHTLYGEFAKRYGLLKPLSRMLWWLMRDYHNRADANLTVSSIMREDLCERGFERVALWPPAVDSKLFHPTAASPEMRNRLSGGRPEEPLVLTVSRLAPEKNVGFLADVMRRLPDARLAVVGDGPQRAELERRFAGTKTNFLGYLAGKDLAAAYASADAFVFASEMETMGNVVLEAMSCGLSVVAPRAGGIPSLVNDGQDGLLFTPGNAAEAAELLRTLLTNEALRTATAKSARERASGCDWADAAESVRECYLQTIAAQRSKTAASEKQRRLAPLVLASLVLTFRASAAMRGGLRGMSRAPLADPGTAESTAGRFLNDNSKLYGA